MVPSSGRKSNHDLSIHAHYPDSTVSGITWREEIDCDPQARPARDVLSNRLAHGVFTLEEGDTATITTGDGSATIRDAASTTGQSIGSIPDGTNIYTISGPIADTDSSLWYQAGVWDVTGYINASLLEDADAPLSAVEEEMTAPTEFLEVLIMPRQGT